MPYPPLGIMQDPEEKGERNLKNVGVIENYGCLKQRCERIITTLGAKRAIWTLHMRIDKTPSISYHQGSAITQVTISAIVLRARGSTMEGVLVRKETVIEKEARKDKKYNIHILLMCNYRSNIAATVNAISCTHYI